MLLYYVAILCCSHPKIDSSWLSCSFLGWEHSECQGELTLRDLSNTKFWAIPDIKHMKETLPRVTHLRATKMRLLLHTARHFSFKKGPAWTLLRRSVISWYLMLTRYRNIDSPLSPFLSEPNPYQDSDGRRCCFYSTGSISTWGSLAGDPTWDGVILWVVPKNRGYWLILLWISGSCTQGKWGKSTDFRLLVSGMNRIIPTSKDILKYPLTSVFTS